MNAQPQPALPDFSTARFNMVESQMRPNKVRDPRLLDAMGSLPREMFVPTLRAGIAYIDAGVKMLPVVEEDGRSTGRRILAYSVALIPISILPAFLGMAGKVYLFGAVALGFALLYFGVRLATLNLPLSAAASKTRARHVLQATVIYLPLLFVLMTINSPHT